MNPDAVHVSAPVRLDFTGGWSDVAPFAMEERGSVINAAIELRTHATIAPNQVGYALSARDLAETIAAADLPSLLRHSGLDLHRAAIGARAPAPCTLTTWAEAPASAGLGGSGAIGVAMMAAFAHAAREPVNPGEVAEAAWAMETRDAHVAGGKQDQYAAAHGNFLRLEFSAGKVAVRMLAVDRRFATELARRTVVCYTGESRLSSGTITRVMDRYRDRDPQVTAALRGMAGLSDAMERAIIGRDVTLFAELLSANWEFQQMLDPVMRSPGMEELERAMFLAGAIGGKAAGSGAGGTMFFVGPDDPTPLAMAATRLGARLLPLEWSWDGIRIHAETL